MRIKFSGIENIMWVHPISRNRVLTFEFNLSLLIPRPNTWLKNNKSILLTSTGLTCTRTSLTCTRTGLMGYENGYPRVMLASPLMARMISSAEQKPDGSFGWG